MESLLSAQVLAEDAMATSKTSFHSLCKHCQWAFNHIQELPLRTLGACGLHAEYCLQDSSRPSVEINGDNLRIPLHSTISQFKESISLRCHFCIILKEYLSSEVPPEGNCKVEIRFRQLTPKCHYIWPRVYNSSEFNELVHKKEPIFNGQGIQNTEMLSNIQCAEHTSSHAHGVLASQWISECRAKHSMCRPATARNGFNPTRLMRLDHSNVDTIYLHDTSPQEAELEYITLSHCWGGATSIPQLTSSSESSLKTGIPTASLPRNFRDAVTITRSLGLQYLWIDSLCIMQDSAEDWRKEASRMATVYENSHVTIAAAAASDPFFGCFNVRDPLVQTALHVPSDDPTKDIYVVPPWNAARQMPALVESSVLLTRGWVFQETMLSPRVLLFCKNGIAWSCRAGDASEVVPGGVTPSFALTGRPMSIGTPSSLDYYGNKPQHRHDAEVFIPGRRLLNAVLRAADNMVAPQMNESPKIEFSEFWLSVVRQYTELNLTFSKDRLIAISAIAQRVKDHSRFTYLAGLWEETIALDLLWNTKHPESALRQETYQAPSWSWGCLNAVISNDRWGNGDYKGSSPKTWIANVQAHVNSHVEDISGTGQVFEGSRLCLDGYLYPCSHMDNRQRTLFGGISWKLHATTGAGDDGFSAWFLPDVESEVRALDCGLVRLLPVLSSDMISFQGGINFWGLVLLLSGTSFTRIGVWSTRTRPDRFSHLKPGIILV